MYKRAVSVNGSEVIYETGVYNTFYYFGNERQIRDWPIV